MQLQKNKAGTAWAAGVSFDIGSTSLGIGMDSEKLMQAGSVLTSVPLVANSSSHSRR